MKKIASFLLALALLLGCFVPGVLATQARAEDNTGDSTNNSGMYIHKTATYNSSTDDYTITLEAYATGEKVTTTVSKEKPTDIILVLDQSGSMAGAMGNLAYAMYTKENQEHRNTNSNLYDHRYNQGEEPKRNLYYKLDENTYVSVSVDWVVKVEDEDVNKITNGKNNSSYGGATNYYYSQGNLYAKVNGVYEKVTVTRQPEYSYPSYPDYDSERTYTYKVGEIVIATSKGDYTSPTFTDVDGNCLYILKRGSNPEYVYTYYYTNENGEKITITTSEGWNTNVENWEFYYSYTDSKDSRLATLKTAVTKFTKEVKRKSKGADGIENTDDDVAFSIAVVGFGSDSRGNTQYQNTELFIGSTQYNYNSYQIDNQYKNALQDISNDTGYYNVLSSINALAADGGTAINLGTEMANSILKAYENDKDHKDREKVVIIFTDGVPGIKTDDNNSTRKSYANSAISNTHTTKNTYGATVYTIGVFKGADARNANNLTNKTDWDDSEVANKFLHILSSNYLSATSMDSYGTLNPLCNNGNKSYYLSAADAETLNAIFSQISSEIQTGGSSTTLDSSAVIKDIVAPQFQLPEGATAANITLESYACTGKSGDTYTWQKNDTALGATATVNGDKVNVTGFNFSANWVGTETSNGSTTYRGNKLVIKFNVKTKDGFLGGNDVYTNTSAGVYKDSTATTPEFTFNRPQVNVPIKDVNVIAADKNVYLLGSLTAEEIKSGATAKCGNVELKLGADNYGLESWQTDYVKIEVTYKDEKGNDVTNLEDLDADTTYTVSVTVSPKTDGSSTDQGTKAETKTGSGEGKINVFTPELTFKDSEVYYGDTAPTDYADNYESTKTVWKHGETKSTDEGITMIGTAPTLTLDYDPEDDKIVEGKIATKDDIPVDVTVKIGNTDVTDKTTFQHTPCTDGETVPENKEFLLHVKTCSLTIEKKAATGTTIGKDEYFVFNVKKDNQPYTQVTIQGTDSVVIKELPVGTYTVEEDASTAWRYTSSMSDNGSVTLSKDKTSGTVTCTNTIQNDKWLNHFNRVTNIFGQANPTPDYQN